MPELVLATQNPGKIAELRGLLAPLGYAVLGLADLGDPPPEPNETGDTFEENATIKALAYAAATGRLCLADDSGLEVDALGGRPGVISSHYAFDGRTAPPAAPAASMTREQRDAANNARLLADLAHTPEPARTARFTCTMALAAPASLLFSPPHTRDSALQADGGLVAPRSKDPTLLALTTGHFHGRIALPHQVRGSNGFGYDPLFLVAPEFTRTSAELTPDEKNRLSHRGHALHAMAEHLRHLAPTFKDP